MTQITLRENFAKAAIANEEEAAELKRSIGDVRSRARYAEVLAIRHALLARQQRGRFFNPKLFADPAWDMLLELYVAALTQRRITVSRLAERASVPMTTALRWIVTLEKEGLVIRENDRFDRRRVFLSLTDKGQDAMAAYFEQLHPGTRIL
jgi:DNA-binding MarR family transcriptional regulator